MLCFNQIISLAYIIPQKFDFSSKMCLQPGRGKRGRRLRKLDVEGFVTMWPWEVVMCTRHLSPTGLFSMQRASTSMMRASRFPKTWLSSTLSRQAFSVNALRSAFTSCSSSVRAFMLCSISSIWKEAARQMLFSRVLKASFAKEEIAQEGKHSFQQFRSSALSNHVICFVVGSTNADGRQTPSLGIPQQPIQKGGEKIKSNRTPPGF